MKATRPEVAPIDTLGKYTLLRPIAQGGMAELFLAKQEGPAGFSKTVVIKRVLPHLARDRQFVEMFLDEARLAARLAHPNIVSISDFGEANGTYFLCMEYLEGRDLDAILRFLKQRGRVMPATVAALIVSAVCDGLHYAHTRKGDDGQPMGIVHRDISPSNIFLTFQGAVKILDFGIAKAEGRLAKTETGSIKGKLKYMAPEQAREEPLDARSDVFALGLVLYELVVGKHPFTRDNAFAAFKAITEEEAPAPTSVRGDVPEQLEAITIRAIKRDPAERFQSAKEMRLALDEFLETRTSVPAAAQLQGFIEELGLMSEPEEIPHPPAPPASHTRADKPLRTAKLAVASGPGKPAEGEALAKRDRASSPLRGRWPLLIGTLALLLALGGVGFWLRSRASPPTPVAKVEPPAPTPSMKEEVPPPPPLPVKAYGRLTVLCLPWCEVYVDGKLVAKQSPLMNYRVEAGAHKIKAINPDTHVTRLVEVDVLPGQNRKVPLKMQVQ